MAKKKPRFYIGMTRTEVLKALNEQHRALPGQRLFGFEDDVVDEIYRSLNQRRRRRQRAATRRRRRDWRQKRRA